MSAADFSISVNGIPLSFITDKWGDPEVTWRWPYGSWSLTWRLHTPFNWRHAAVKRGAPVIGRVGPVRVWGGTLSEIDYDELTFTADGWARQAESTLALTSGGDATMIPNVAIDQGFARGALTWQRNAFYPFDAAAFSSVDAADIRYTSQLLDAWAASQGRKWWVDVDGWARNDPDPTVPTFQVTPGVGVLGVADEEYVTHLYGVYASAPGATAAVLSQDQTQGVGRVERRVDLTALGFIPSAKAQSITDSLIARGGARTGWTRPIEVTDGQVTTLGGTPVDLWRVQPGPRGMLHLAGLTDERGSSLTTNVVLEETAWTPTEGRAVLKPVGLAARDFASIVESMGATLL